VSAGTISPPTVNRSDTLAYYTSLASSPDSDYLRVAIDTSPTFDVIPGTAANLSPGQTNRVTVQAMLGDGVGVFGKPFSAAAQSVILGIALVAGSPSDPTRDVVFARSYYPQAQQTAKSAAGQLGVRYRYPFP
jgi:hypothetical protein